MAGVRGCSTLLQPKAGSRKFPLREEEGGLPLPSPVFRGPADLLRSHWGLGKHTRLGKELGAGGPVGKKICTGDMEAEDSGSLCPWWIPLSLVELRESQCPSQPGGLDNH